MTEAAIAIDTTREYYGSYNFIAQESWSTDVVFFRKQATESKDLTTLFRQLVKEWKSDTYHVSIVSYRFQHPSYQQILRLGKSVVPLILKELERENDHWFHALNLLTGENPIPADFTGTVSDAADLWIEWGRTRYAS